MDPLWIAVVLVVAVLVTGAIFIVSRYAALFVASWTSGATVWPTEIAGMLLRRSDVRGLILSRIRAAKVGIDIPVRTLETHELAGGSTSRVVNALVAARAARIPLSWDDAAAIDLSGVDPLGAVRAVGVGPARVPSDSYAVRPHSQEHPRGSVILRPLACEPIPLDPGVPESVDPRRDHPRPEACSRSGSSSSSSPGSRC